MERESKIFIAGHRGMVGSAIVRNLKSRGYNNFLLRTFGELDLSRQDSAEKFFREERPEYVFLAAAKVGGIVANNTYRAEFLYDNLMIQSNVVDAARKNGVRKLLFLGSSCIYPKSAPQPLKEEYLLTGPLEITNEPYAIAKIAGIKMCENYYRQYGCDFISVMPTNLYGPNDNYDLERSHVLPALIRKMHLGRCLEDSDFNALRRDLERNPAGEPDGGSPDGAIIELLERYGITAGPARAGAGSPDVTVTLWGTGNVYREFLHVDDVADACVHIMESVDAVNLYDDMKQTHINIGTGTDITIRELAEVVKKITGFRGRLNWDSSKPDGTPRKQLDVKLLRELGWRPAIGLEEGIRSVYGSYTQS